MVVFYDITTLDCQYSEWDSLIPSIPVIDEQGKTQEEIIKEKRQILSTNNLDFVSLIQNCNIDNMRVCFDVNKNFIGLQPK